MKNWYEPRPTDKELEAEMARIVDGTIIRNPHWFKAVILELLQRRNAMAMLATEGAE